MKTFVESKGMPAVSSARKLIIQVPPGNKVKFPEGVVISPYGQNNNTPSIVVHNKVDVKDTPNGTWQGADSEKGIVIMNGVKEVDALALINVFNANPTVETLNEVVTKADSLGYKDIYTTDTAFVDAKLSPAGPMVNKYVGLVKQDDRDVVRLARDNKGVIWRSKGDDFQHIDNDKILTRDYVQPDGSPIDPAMIPVIDEM